MSTKSLGKWEAPTDVSDLDLAFPARGEELTPPFYSLPSDFQDLSNRWCGVVEDAFFGRGGVEISVRSDISFESASRHLRVVMGTFATKHEHKIAGAGYLMSRWFKFADGALS